MTAQESLMLASFFSAIASLFALYFFLRGIIALIRGKRKIAGVTLSGKKARIFSLFLIAQLPLAFLLLVLLHDPLDWGG